MNAMLKQIRSLKNTQGELGVSLKADLASLSPLVSRGVKEAKGINAAIEEANKSIVKKYNDEVKLRKQYYNTIQVGMAH